MIKKLTKSLIRINIYQILLQNFPKTPFIILNLTTLKYFGGKKYHVFEILPKKLMKKKKLL